MIDGGVVEAAEALCRARERDPIPDAAPIVAAARGSSPEAAVSDPLEIRLAEAVSEETGSDRRVDWAETPGERVEAGAVGASVERA